MSEHEPGHILEYGSPERDNSLCFLRFLVIFLVLMNLFAVACSYFDLISLGD